MAGISTEDEHAAGVVDLGRDLLDTVKRLVLLEIELIKAQAKATALRLALGVASVALALTCAMFFVVFLIGTIDEGTSLNDNALILGFVAGLPATALFTWLGSKMPRILHAIVLVIAAVIGVATVAALLAFMIVAIVDPGTNALRRGWAISALSFLLVLIVSGAGGAWLILRAISGSRETATDVRHDVMWAVDDVKSRRWRD